MFFILSILIFYLGEKYMKKFLSHCLCFFFMIALFACASPVDQSKTVQWPDASPLSRPPIHVQSAHRDPIPFLEWEHHTSDHTSIVGHWEGTSFEGRRVAYNFDENRKCSWLVNDKSISGRYEILPSEKYYRIKIDRLVGRGLKDVEFHGIYKMKGNEMLFYGITVKKTDKLERLPGDFQANAMVLKRK